MSAGRGPLRIFLSYRRDDSQGFAGRIYDRLADRFGPEAVFRDINDIEPGRPWAEAIDEALGSCDVFVLLIGKEWLNATDDEGHRRLDDPEDRHRREIEVAVNREIRIFVALLENAPMPAKEQLPRRPAGREANGGRTPKGLQEVPSLQAVVIADFAFDHGIERLIASIEMAAEQEVSEIAKRGPAVVVPEGEREEVATPRREDAQRKRRLGILAAVALGAAAVLVGAVLLLGTGDDGGSAEDGGSAQVAGSLQVGQHPVSLTTTGTGENILVTDRDDQRVVSVEATPDSETLDQNFQGTVGTGPDGVAVDESGSVWVACHGSGEVWKLDAETGEPSRDAISIGGSPSGLAVGDGLIWVAMGTIGEVWGLNPESGTAEHKIKVDDDPYGVAVDDAGLVWVTNRESNSVSQINPNRTADPVIDTIELGEGAHPKGIYAAEDAIWVANSDDGSVTKIDRADTSLQEESPVGSLPRGVVYAFDSIWVSLGGANEVVRLDPESGEQQDRIPIGATSEGITAGPDSIWVANGDDGKVTRISP